jgi:hypothetical protein
MRPIYETSADRKREAVVAETLAVAWDCEMVKLPRQYPVDYMAIREGKPSAFVEIKCKTYSKDVIDRNGGFLMSLAKWANACALCEESGLQFCIAVQYPEALWYCPVRKGIKAHHDGIRFFGRTDRNDPQDMEPCILLKPDRWTEIPNTPADMI